MENIRKGTKVKKICDGITGYLKLKKYIMFEDNWITESDKTLYDEKGDSFSVLDFQEIEEEICISSNVHFNKWINQKFSCVKLDKDLNVGDIFYTYI